MGNMPLASIIILTWNGLEFIEACLNSVLAQTYPVFETLVVDNASTDGTANLVATKFPSVQLIRNEQNLGFAAGVNVGLNQAAGEFLVLLNQDTVVARDWLAELVQGMLTDDKVGVGGCKIYDWSGQKLWHAGVLLDEARKFPFLRGAGEIDNGQYDQPEEMVAVVGAALAIRRELLTTVGLFDEDYYFYLEDTDYCFRARKAGYKVMYYPGATLRHYVAASLKKDSYEVLDRFHLSRMQFLLKRFEPDWFCHSFVPAEKDYLKKRVPLNEFKALRHAYMNTELQLAQRRPGYTLRFDIHDPKKLKEVLAALADLRHSTLSLMYTPQNWSGIDRENSDEAWSVKAFEFSSNIPLLGSLFSGFRRLWSSVAARWIERNLLNHQNAINHKLVALLEIQLGLISTLDAEVSFLQDQLIELKGSSVNLSDPK